LAGWCRRPVPAAKPKPGGFPAQDRLLSNGKEYWYGFAEKTDVCRMIWLDPSIVTTTLLIGLMLSSKQNGQTDNAARRNAKATMDHADIRGLVTAFHLSVAGLPTV
jgi:hypothetical protein